MDFDTVEKLRVILNGLRIPNAAPGVDIMTLPEEIITLASQAYPSEEQAIMGQLMHSSTRSDF